VLLEIEKGKPVARQGRKAIGPFGRRMAAWPPINLRRNKINWEGIQSEKKIFSSIGIGVGVFVSVLIGSNGST